MWWPFKFADFVFSELPDISGILLAAAGVALVFYPEAITKLGPRKGLRGLIAALLVVLGAAGLYSSYVQHRDSDKTQDDLVGKVNALGQAVNTFGPKLDEIIQHPASEQQRQKAVDLKKQLSGAIRQPVTAIPNQQSRLSQKTPPAQPVAQPQTPTYTPVPIPTVSPYQELKSEIADVNSSAQQWKSDLRSIGSSRGLMKRMADPKGRQEANAAADRMFREAVIRLDERNTEHWHSVTEAVKKAHSGAIARMGQRGPMQWTPNQISKDRTEFNALLAPIERGTEDPDKPDEQKFDPLLGYLNGLLGKLGDYPESVTPSQ